jgi:hypothetical protein
VKREILSAGEKVHLIQRRQLEQEPQRHFIGVVDAYENGVFRVTGNVYTVDTGTFKFFRRPESRTRIVSAASGEVLINVLPPSVDLDRIVYKQEKKWLRISDGSAWHLDISESGWTSRSP